MTVKVVPGNRPYNQAHIKNITIALDSMTRSIKNRELNDLLKSSGVRDVRAKVYKFPGANAKQICRYSKLNIEDDDSHALLVISGTNSLRQQKTQYDRLSDETIAKQIIQTGINAKKQGVTNVFISGIIFRRGTFYQNQIFNINEILRGECLKLGFFYIDQSNIRMEHLCKDGLHLNEAGTSILKNNILRILC